MNVPLISLLSLFAATALTAQPNVIVLITDDQGFGDLSCHGNPVVQTPHLDRLHNDSIRLTDFHVAPMCTPTRGQLMTGLDALRNGATNVSSGRTLLRHDLPTMADFFSDAGYSTGLFGKWHLGDNFPFRPQDRGFQDALWFPSSHISSSPDVWENDYFDDRYMSNGHRRDFKGYTTDVFFKEAITWMKQQHDAGEPFFCYLPTAAPHWPHFVPDSYRLAVGQRLTAALPTLPPLTAEQQDELARFLGMIENIDANVGKLEAFLRDEGLRDNTIFIYLTDNGSTMGESYYNAGMRGKKVTLWEGGHRVPCFIRWPNENLRPSGDVDGLTQAQDLLPTLIDLCQLDADGATFDGISLAPILTQPGTLPPDNRMLVINYSRMPFAAKTYRPDSNAVPTRESAAVLWQRWRLLEDKELYALDSDPLQQTNVITEHPDVVEKMRHHLNVWWDEVAPLTTEFQRVIIGHIAENPTQLTACEWADVFIDQQGQVLRGELKNSHWHLNVAEAGQYTFEVRRWPADSGLALTAGTPAVEVTDGTRPKGIALPIDRARLRIGDFDHTTQAEPEAESITFTTLLPVGPTELQTWFQDASGKDLLGAYYVRVERVGP